MEGRTIKIISAPSLESSPIIVKQEILDDDEATISCSLCTKTFCSDVALRNHARMEHFDAYATGDPKNWTLEQPYKEPEKKVVVKAEKSKLQQTIIQRRTDALISSMEPTSLMSLVSKDVSYIIIKADGIQATPVSRKRKVADPKERQEKEKTIKKEKEPPQPITGPFECLQPSNLVTDGTCHQIFFSCCEYSVHFRDEHTRRRKGIRCQVCEKSLSPDMERVLPYPCQICEAAFLTNKELSEHTNEHHSKLKPFQCTICYKRFTQQGGVQQHMRMHTGDRPFSCIYCNKSFTQKSGLDQHLRIHTKIKPYRCVVCSKTFCQSIHLKQHMRTHTNVAPFQCGICEKRFKQSSHLNYHLKGHHGTSMTEEQKKKFSELVEVMDNNIVEVKSEPNVTYQDIEEMSAEELAGEEYHTEEMNGEEYQTEEISAVEISHGVECILGDVIEQV